MGRSPGLPVSGSPRKADDRLSINETLTGNAPARKESCHLRGGCRSRGYWLPLFFCGGHGRGLATQSPRGGTTQPAPFFRACKASFLSPLLPREQATGRIGRCGRRQGPVPGSVLHRAPRVHRNIRVGARLLRKSSVSCSQQRSYFSLELRRARHFYWTVCMDRMDRWRERTVIYRDPAPWKVDRSPVQAEYFPPYCSPLAVRSLQGSKEGIHLSPSIIRYDKSASVLSCPLLDEIRYSIRRCFTIQYFCSFHLQHPGCL